MGHCRNGIHCQTHACICRCSGCRPEVKDGERARERALVKVWKIVTSVSPYSISVTGPHLTLTKRLDVLRRALEAAYDAGAKSERSPG